MNGPKRNVYGDPVLDRTNKLFNISSIVYILLIASVVYHPLVYHHLQRYIRFPLVVLSLVTLAVTFFTNKSVRRYYTREVMNRKAELAFAFLWGMTIEVEILLGRSDNTVDYNLLSGYAWGMVMYIVGIYHGYSTRSIVMWSYITLIACAVTVALSLQDIMNNPYVIRLNTTFLNNNEAEKVVISAGTWIHITTMSIASAVWIAMILHTRSILLSLSAAAMLGILAFAMLTVTLASVVMYLFLACLIILIYLLVFPKQRYFLRICVFSIVFVLLAWILFRFSLSYEAFVDAWNKLERIFVGVLERGSEGDETGRASILLNYTLSAIAKSPIIGNGTTSGNAFTAGGHAHFLDVIAWYGIIGAIPFYGFMMCLYWRCAKAWFKHKHELILFGILVCSFVYFVQGIVGGILLPYMTTLVYYFLAMPSANNESRMHPAQGAFNPPHNIRQNDIGQPN